MVRKIVHAKIAILCWVALFIVLVCATFAIRLEPVVRLDQHILGLLAAGRTAACDRFFTYISWAGSSYILMPLTYAIAVTAAFRNHVQEAIFLICSFMGGSLLNNLIKHVVARPRPDLFSAVIDIPADFSFPSSHAAQITSFVIAALLAMKSTKGTRWYVVFNGCGGSLIILVCVSRLYLQVHFPSDVVAGFLVGLLWVFGLATLMLPGHQAQTISLCTWRAEKGTQQ